MDGFEREGGRDIQSTNIIDQKPTLAIEVIASKMDITGWLHAMMVARFGEGNILQTTETRVYTFTPEARIRGLWPPHLAI